MLEERHGCIALELALEGFCLVHLTFWIGLSAISSRGCRRRRLSRRGGAQADVFAAVHDLHHAQCLDLLGRLSAGEEAAAAVAAREVEKAAASAAAAAGPGPAAAPRADIWEHTNAMRAALQGGGGVEAALLAYDALQSE